MAQAPPSSPLAPTTAGQATLQDLIEMWRGFFTATFYLEPGRRVRRDEQGRPRQPLPSYTDKIRALAHIYPQERALEVPFEEVDDFSPTLGAAILTRAQETLQAAEMAVFEEIPEADQERVLRELQTKLTISVEVTQIPKEEVGVEVRHIRKEHLNRLVSVKVLVRKAMEVRPRVTLGHFLCEWERHPNRLAQDFFMFREPRLCRERDCKCSDFRFIPERSIYVDSQMLEVQEFPESLPAGAQPERLVVYAEEVLAARVMPGDRVVINGILRQRQKRRGSQPLTTFDIYLHAVSMDERVTEFEDLVVSDEELEQIHETARAPRLRQRIVGSVAPSIYGMQMEKTAIALLLFGGVAKQMPDGNRIRGDIHMLLVGDPGVAKSQLLRYVSHLAPRGILTSGKSATAAGLTAAAVRDEFGDGRWTLEAGALVMADGGVACIDEIDKMSESDRASMHEAMEQQSISVAKAGITAELQARCSVLGAANPKYGRFDDTQSLHSQINMPPTLLSRFDIIFTIADKPQTERDQALAHHILEEHFAGELLRQEALGQLPSESEQLIEQVKQTIAPALSGDFLRKYLAVARRESIPVLSDAARDRLQRYYVHMRALSAKEGGFKISITPRQLEAMVRLSEASARMHLRQEVDEEDAQLAIDILEHFLEHVAGGDVDSFMSDHSAQERANDPRVILTKTLRELCGVAAEGLVEEEELILETTKKGLSEKKARQVFSVLREEGTILESQGRFYAY